jgi:hypothetical protein
VPPVPSCFDPTIYQSYGPLGPAGDPFTFLVGATGGGLTYQWFFRTNAIPGATNVSYTLASVQPTNTGGYFVRVTLLAA